MLCRFHEHCVRRRPKESFGKKGGHWLLCNEVTPSPARPPTHTHHGNRGQGVIIGIGMMCYYVSCASGEEVIGCKHRVHRVATAAFWRTFSGEGKIGPGWWGWGVHAHPLSLHLPSPVKLQCTLQLSGQTHLPCFISRKICTLWVQVAESKKRLESCIMPDFANWISSATAGVHILYGIYCFSKVGGPQISSANCKSAKMRTSVIC